MKNVFLLYIFLFSALTFGQEDTNWYAYYNTDSTKIGYRDAKGNVKIEPKFNPFATEQIFKEVIAVSEIISENKHQSYYLNKKGKKFGIDSTYLFDFEYATFNDGKIKFHDYKTDRVGFFDANGKVIIPAIYNDAGDFREGIVRVLIGAKRWCYDTNSEKSENCEHYGWKDGRNIMINNKNEELFEIPEKKDYSYTLDYSKFKVNEKTDPDIYTSYKGNDGNIYSFYSPERDFNKWFYTVFIPDFEKHNTILPKYFYELISVSDNDHPKEYTAWKNHKKDEYMKNNITWINDIFKKVSEKKFQALSSWEWLTNYSYFPENELPKQNLKDNTVISLTCREENDYSAQNTFQFTKIGNSFYITSAPNFH